MTLKELTEARFKELQKTRSKDAIVADHSKMTDEQTAERSSFYKALATGDRAALKEIDANVQKEYKEKAQDIGTPADGGILVPTTVADSIVAKMVYISPLRQIATVITNMPASLQLPSETALPTVYWEAEGSAPSDSGSAFAGNLLTPYKLMGLDAFTSEVLADAATNPSIQDFVEQRFALALTLKENDAFVNGDGSGKPYGFRSSAITPGTVDTATAGVTTYDDVVSLKYGLATAYRKLGVYVTTSAGVEALEKIKDSYGRPIFREGLAEDTPATLLGRPLYVVDEVPANITNRTVANCTEIWFGMFSNYFIGDRGGLRVDMGTNGTDFASDKISLRLIKRVAGRPVLGESFAKLNGVK